MADNRMIDELSTEDQLPLRPALRSLKTEFQGTFDDETVEQFVIDSFVRLAATSKARNFLGVIDERFARERLGAMTRMLWRTVNVIRTRVWTR